MFAMRSSPTSTRMPTWTWASGTQTTEHIKSPSRGCGLESAPISSAANTWKVEVRTRRLAFRRSQSQILTEEGIPFHKKGTKPKAACPACVEARGDHSKKALFAVRGAKKGEYDERIPKNWFDTPPVTLTTEGKGMDAMRANKVPMS